MPRPPVSLRRISGGGQREHRSVSAVGVVQKVVSLCLRVVRQPRVFGPFRIDALAACSLAIERAEDCLISADAKFVERGRADEPEPPSVEARLGKLEQQQDMILQKLDQLLRMSQEPLTAQRTGSASASI